MPAKHPCWISPAAHARLVAYCAATGRTMLDVASEAILRQTSEAIVREKVAAEANPKPGLDWVGWR